MSMRTLLLVPVLLLISCGARADTVWDYAGNATSGASNVNPLGQPFLTNPCACALDGTVTLDGNTPVAWSFTVAGLTLTNLNSTGTINDDLNGANPTVPFYTWRILLSGPGGAFIGSYFDGSTYEATDSALVPGGALGMIEEGNKGTWTDPPVGTPEPSSLMLLVIALVFMSILYYHPTRRSLTCQ